jgi:serine protease Do
MGVTTSFIGRSPRGTAFFDSVMPKGSSMGADLNPVRTQLAGYFGVSSGTGLLVENVDRDSPSDLAGLKAGDVITKVESQSMKTKSDWTKAMHSLHSHAIQITVMRNKQQILLTMNQGKPKKN